MTTKYLDGTGLRYFRDTYVLTTTQVNALIQSAFAQYKQDVFTVVSALPQTGQQEGIMYLVPSSNDPTKLDGYIWEIVDDTTTPPTYGWKHPVVGQGQIDLSNYYTKTEADTKFDNRLKVVTNTSATLSALAALIVIITEIAPSSIRLIRICIQYARSELSDPTVNPSGSPASATISFAPNQLIRSMQV